MLAIFQTYFNTESKAALDPGFIPYDNTGKVTAFFENDVIKDVYENKKELWENAEYVGVLSWRFKEKTELTSEDVRTQIWKKPKRDVYSLNPAIYDHYKNPYHETGFKNVVAICKIMDKKGIFPFKLFNYDPGKHKTFCNFFLAKPEIFTDYMENYFMRMYNFLNTCKDKDFLKERNTLINYRGALYPVHPMIMEGLFECYANYKNYSVVRIEKEKEEEKVEIPAVVHDSIIVKPAVHIIQNQFAHV